jgi:hypothetical protein
MLAPRFIMKKAVRFRTAYSIRFFCYLCCTRTIDNASGLPGDMMLLCVLSRCALHAPFVLFLEHIRSRMAREMLYIECT